MRLFRRRLACSFCGKRDSEVAKLVAGPRVFICDACVAIAQRLMAESGDTTPPQEARGGVFQRTVARIRGAARGLGTGDKEIRRSLSTDSLDLRISS
jgi:ATP-dependent protease Clp ATPase subunit